MDESDTQFVDEYVIKIICDAIEKVFGIKAKQEGKDQKIVQEPMETAKEKEILSNIEYKHDKATEQSQQLIDNCLRGLLKLNKP